MTSIEYPVALNDRKTSNPDGFQTGWSISVINGSHALPTIPVLYADQARYDSKRGGKQQTE